MVNVAKPSPKRASNEAAKAVKDTAITAKKAAPKANKPKKTRLRKRNKGDWTYKDDERVYIVEPHRPDVHKYTVIYLHNASGNPKEYFTVDGFQTPGLRVVLPKGPVYRLFHGKDVKTNRSRVWYEYYHDPQDPNEDPSQGADAEELELDSDEEKEAEAARRKAAGIKVKKEDEEEEEEKEKPVKFSEFIKTISPDAHPEIQIPKEAQVKKSIDRVLALIHKEAAALGGDYSRVFLGGWSQGGTLALCTAIHKDCPSLGGVLTVSGTFHADKVNAALRESSVKSTPFVLYVGTKDDTYPVMLLHPLIERLREKGYQIDIREKNMDHCLNGNIGAPDKIEERWIKQWIAAMYEDSSLGALMTAHSAVALLGAKEHEAAVKVIHGLLFGNRLPHNRKAEIMKYSCSGAVMPEMNKRVNKLSADDLTLVARFFGAESCTAPDLARFLATPTAAGLAALRAGPDPMDLD